MARKYRGATPEEDIARGSVSGDTISSVRAGKDGWDIGMSDGWHCWLAIERFGDREPPQVGDQFRCYGEIGMDIHGQELRGEILWYLTVEQQEAEFARRSEEHRRQKLADFEANRTKLDADYGALPLAFRQRIDKFRRTNPNFRVEFESYEMGCCTDAVKIADYCRSLGIGIKEYRELPWDDQMRAGVSDGHSGNSFGMACRLAHWWLTNPENVTREHGALVPLVGCEEYGCPH